MGNFRRRERIKPPERKKYDKTPQTSPTRNRHRLIPLTIGEIRRLLNLPRHDHQALDHGLYWSAWRRQHQADTRWNHFRRRLRRRLQTLQI